MPMDATIRGHEGEATTDTADPSNPQVNPNLYENRTGMACPKIMKMTIMSPVIISE